MMKFLCVFLFGLNLMLLGGCSPAEKEPTVEKIYSVGGMTCEGCVKAITAEAPKLKGVESVDVNLESEQARLEVHEKTFQGGELKTRMKKMGYTFEELKMR